MKLKLLPILTLITIIIFMGLSGCNDNDPEYQMQQPATPFALTSTIPLSQTIQFPRSGKIIFHFNQEIDGESLIGAVKFNRLNDDGSKSDVLFYTNAVGNNVFVRPRSLLYPSSNFEVTINDKVRSVDDQMPMISEGTGKVNFSTGAIRAQAFVRPKLIAVSPDPEVDFIPDSVSFRLYFSEPIDESSVTYPFKVKLVNDSQEIVPAKVFACEDKIVVDPETDLNAESTYSLVVEGIVDRNGETMEDDYSVEFNVVSTFPKSELPVIMCPTLGDKSPDECVISSDPANLLPSAYTGDLLNTMNIESTLLGRGTIYISGKLVTELGNPGIDENFVPITIRKGQKLYGKGIEALLGGQIETGYETGDIVLTLISDANGFLAGSNFIHGVEGAETALVLTMDVVVNTASQDPATNAMMTQSVLGVRLLGSAKAVGGKLFMEVAGFTEMKVQGETIPTTMAMLMVSMDKSDSTIKEDLDGPRVRSTTPIINESRVRLTQRIVANFDEPVDPESINANFSVQTTNGAVIAGTTKTLGAKAIFIPSEFLFPNTEYYIVLGAGIADLNGNIIGATDTVRFRTGTDEASELEDNPPLITTTHPGLYDQVDIPAQFPIIICFNQIMDESSIRLGDTFRVYDVTQQNSNVRGTIYFHGSYIVFEPNDLWEKGHTYSVSISDEITNIYGLALDLDADRFPGGTDDFFEFVIEFKAGSENKYVLLALKLDPLVDVNGSGYIDGNEIGADTNSIKMNVPLLDLFQEPSYVGGHMISWIKGLEYNQNSAPYLAVDINDGTYMNGTSVNATIFKNKDAPDGLFEPMGRISIDVIETGSADITKGAGGKAQMNVSLKTLFNVENATFNEMLQNNLGLKTKGILTFSKDGRMVADISGSTLIRGNFDVPLVGWDIPLFIPTNINMRAVGEALPYY